jgi:hypothetical protein
MALRLRFPLHQVIAHLFKRAFVFSAIALSAFSWLIAPASVLATNGATCEINLLWFNNDSTVNGFMIERATSLLGPWTQIARVPASPTSYQDTTVVPNGIYYYRLRSYNSAGVSGYSNVAIGTAPCPGAPDTVGDGIPDLWRQAYFGGIGITTNDLSCATCDADATGQNNLFKYEAGLDPTNPAAIFKVTAGFVPTLPHQFNTLFNPVVAGRVYTPQYSTNLVSGVWLPLTGYSGPVTNGTQVTITDLNATGPRKYYRIGVSLSSAVPPFAITSITRSGHDVNLVWNGQPGSNVVQVSTGTATGGYTNNFVDLAVINVPSFGVTNYVDSGGATNGPSRFYRIDLRQ